MSKKSNVSESSESVSESVSVRMHVSQKNVYCLGSFRSEGKRDN